MHFVHLMNETAVVFVRDINAYEAYSPIGEIKEFSTWNEANAWRIAECVDFMNGPYYPDNLSAYNYRAYVLSRQFNMR